MCFFALIAWSYFIVHFAQQSEPRPSVQSSSMEHALVAEIADTTKEDSPALIVQNGVKKETTETTPSAPREHPGFYEVVKTVDGDTIDVRIDGKIERLRLIGMDTPETVDPRKPVQCFGVAASNKTKELLLGKWVRLEEDETQGTRDVYGRLLRYVFLEDGTNFNKRMIAEGYAHEYTYRTPYTYQEAFRAAEKEARENKRGLWADGVCAAEGKTEPTKSPMKEDNVTAPPQGALQTGERDCTRDTYNCSDFTRHDEAQKIFDYCKQEVGSDIHQLDQNNDGKACESLR